MGDIVLAGATSGTTTLTPTAVSGTTTLTLPATTDTLVGRTTTDTLTNKTLGAGTVLPAGSILQVVSTTKSDTFSSATTGSFLDVTGLTVSITPASASNKIMVFGRITGIGQAATTRMQMRLVRDSTAISVGDASSNRVQVSGNEMFAGADDLFGSTVFYLDSPSTTSSTTYKIQVKNGNSSGTVYVNRTQTNTDAGAFPVATSSITVMEVKG